jgi:hypothetical protein
MKNDSVQYCRMGKKDKKAFNVIELNFYKKAHHVSPA